MRSWAAAQRLRPCGFVALAVVLMLVAAPAHADHMLDYHGDLVLTGELVDSDLDAVKESIAGRHRKFFLKDCFGGPMFLGLAIAAELAEIEATTVAEGLTASSCANIFLGGSRRVFRSGGKATSGLWLHEPYDGRTLRILREFSPDYIAWLKARTADQFTDDLVYFLRKADRPNGGLVFLAPATPQDADGLVFFCDGTERHVPYGCMYLEGKGAKKAGLVTDTE